ncbi:MAG: hypothetical protein E7376_03615 [Clostridiales bacterium]|nr:hypothetical protein [Clostridiales bacterium]
MPRGYTLTSYYDAARAMHRKIYSREIKRLSSVIKTYDYLNHNLYGLIISSINNGIEDNLGELSSKLHHVSRADIGVNKSSLLQDFMSPLELRLNAIAIRSAYIEISRIKNNCRLSDIQDICYRAGQNAALNFRTLKQGKNIFDMQINSPVLSTKPIIKKYDEALKLGTYPKNAPIEYTDYRKEERRQLLIQNQIVFNNIKEELTRLGFVDKASRKMAFKMLNLGYYFVEDPKTGSLELTTLLYYDYLEEQFEHTELEMNLEKLGMAKERLKTLKPGISYNAMLSEMYKTGHKARAIIVQEHGMLPEMFPGFYQVYSEAEKINVINKERFTNVNKPNINKDK